MNSGRAQVWLVTGASSGLGQAITVAARAAGHIVVGAARRSGDMRLDVTDPAAAEPAVREVVDRYGRLDVLVNNAGRAIVGAAEETTDADLREIMDLHFFGPVALAKAALPYMRAQGSGAIVQISSVGGQLAFAGVSAYCAGKWAIEGWSEALAPEVAPFGIRVLIVEPGAFRTGLHGPAMHESAAMAEYEPVLGPAREAQRTMAGAEPGDPAKAADAILVALGSERPPLRLVLGNDAADAILHHLDTTRAELTAWEKLTRGTDFPAGRVDGGTRLTP